MSRLVDIKGIDLNLQAIARLVGKFPQLEYVVVGDGPDRPALQRLAQQLRISTKVRFLGMQPHHEVLRIMAAADIFAIPSWREGFGVVYVEAMAHGVPAIGCRGQGIDGTIKHNINWLLVEPKNIEALAHNLDFLLSNPREARRIGELGEETVLNGYTWEHNARRLISVYRSVIRNSRDSFGGPPLEPGAGIDDDRLIGEGSAPLV